MDSKVKVILSMVFFMALTTGCAAAGQQHPASGSQTFTWNVQAEQVEIKPALSTTEVVTLYNGDKNEVLHENKPADGNTYLILKLKIQKTGSAAAAFEWKNLSVSDKAGKQYFRLENDSFLEQHHYSPRMTGLTIRFGESEGWVCFEVPQTSASSTLNLVYVTSEGQQQVELHK